MEGNIARDRPTTSATASLRLVTMKLRDPCWTCGGDMADHHSNARYCSTECRKPARRKAAATWRAQNRSLANARTAAWHEANRERELALGRDYAYRRTIEKHGLTVERFNEMCKNGCMICGRKDPTGQGRPHIDHDHECCPGEYSCGKCIRGVLCSNCNVGLGYLGDSLEALEKATAYLWAYEVANTPRHLWSVHDRIA